MCALFSKSSVEKVERPPEVLDFRFYRPSILTDQLVPGIDNIRFDVAVSAKFLQFCQGLILQLLVQHSPAAELINNAPAPPKSAERNEFKQQLQNLLIHVLNVANSSKNPQLELLARAALVKALQEEIQGQYALVVLRAREKLRLFDSISLSNRSRGHQLRELLGNFQKDKKVILRHVSREILEMMESVCGDVVRKTRESFFGAPASEVHSIFSQPLLFTEDGKDDYLCLEHYAMLGNFTRDPDRLDLVEQHVRDFLEWADRGSPEAKVYHAAREAHEQRLEQRQALQEPEAETSTAARLLFSRQTRAPLSITSGHGQTTEMDAQLKQEGERLAPLEAAYSERLHEIQLAPANAALLVDYLETGQQITALEKEHESARELWVKAEAQRERLEELSERFSHAGLIPFVLAAYETARIYRHFCPPLNPQQLKTALVDPGERKKVAHLIQEYRLPAALLDTLDDSARRVRDFTARDCNAVLVRFLHDFFRYRQDLRKLQSVQSLLERIHFPSDPKQRELSEINHTLYQFLLPEEEKPLEEKVTSHVILKADIRESTSITARLLARGLNPASYFSLNFFDPVRKLLPRFGAGKVFLEGDAMILSITESEGDTRQVNSVARTCSLAREMIEGLRVVNDRAAQNQLPLLECGIGICFQPSAPMYLMDGERPIMISKALNESDRLSSCGKLAKELLTQKSPFFNVFVMQLLPEADSRGASEEFRLHYNVQGIEMNEAAFEKLCAELSMTRVELKLPVFGDAEKVEFYCGSLPLGAQTFQKLVVRRGRIPQLDPKTLRIVEHTNRYYYEVCTARPIYDFAGKQLGWS